MSDRFVFVLEHYDVSEGSSLHGVYSSLEPAVAVALDLAKASLTPYGDGVRTERLDGSESVVINLLDESGYEMSERWEIRRTMLDADAPQASDPARPPQDQYLAELRAGLDEASGVVWRVGVRGNVAVLELGGHDAYEAVEVAEKIGEALTKGSLEISVSIRWLKPGDKPETWR